MKKTLGWILSGFVIFLLNPLLGVGQTSPPSMGVPRQDPSSVDSLSLEKKDSTLKVLSREEVLKMDIGQLLDLPLDQVLEYARIAGIYPFQTNLKKKSGKYSRKKKTYTRANFKTQIRRFA